MAAIFVKGQYEIRASTTSSVGEYHRQVWKKSDQWSWRICDNEIVIVLNKGEFANYKMAAVQPYKLTDQNHFQGDASRLWEESIRKISTKYLHWLQKRSDNREKYKMADGDHICQWTWTKFGHAQQTTRGTSEKNFKKIWHVVFFWLFFYWGFTALSRIFHLYRADRSSKVG